MTSFWELDWFSMFLIIAPIYMFIKTVIEGYLEHEEKMKNPAYKRQYEYELARKRRRRRWY
uniref:Uncharacterized protein n=1 Tax=uncultured bacterium contig00081 TaxID=1181557 RepID=A0A806KEX0_9BACT|nr:hypothetical protein [uncultured bacterium contig00081]